MEADPDTSLSKIFSALRAVTIGLGLYFYTWLSLRRYLPPFSLYIQLAILLILCGWWLSKVTRRQALARSPLVMPMLTYLGAAALATYFSIDQRRSLDGLLGILAIILLFFFICDLLLDGWNPYTLIAGLLLFVILLMIQGLWSSIDWYGRWFAVRVPEYPAFPFIYRLRGIADSPNIMAMFIYLALPFPIIGFVRSASKTIQIAWGLWLILAYIALFLTGSRGGWIAAAAVILVTTGWLMFRTGVPRHQGLFEWLRSKRVIWLVILSCPIIFLSMNLLLTHTGSTRFELLNLSSNAITGQNQVWDANGRFKIWSIAWKTFLENPIFGSGPLTFSRVYGSQVSISGSGNLPPHAHNWLLESLASTGIIGTLALIWILLAGARAFFRGLYAALQDKPDRGGITRENVLLGCSAALCGMLVHSQVEIPLMNGSVAFIVLILAASGIFATGGLRHGYGGVSPWLSLLLLFPLLLIPLLIRQNMASEALLRGVSAAQEGDWDTAAKSLDQAVVIDPNFTFYHEQRGYAYATLATSPQGQDDPSAIEQSLQSYRIALQSPPLWVPNLLNAAVLLEKSGNPWSIDLQIAALPPDSLGKWPLLALLIADHRIKTSLTYDPELLFTTAFKNDPSIALTLACLRSVSCQTAWLHQPKDPLWDIHEKAFWLINQNHSQEALDLLDSAPIASRSQLDLLLWLDRADAHIALVQYPQARYALQIVEEASTGQNTIIAARLALSKAAIYKAQNEPVNALLALEAQVHSQVKFSNYHYYVYQCIGLPGYLIPELALLEKSTFDLKVYQQLTEYYRSLGLSSEATWAQAQFDDLKGLFWGAK
jgi:O-antigen ligase